MSADRYPATYGPDDDCQTCGGPASECGHIRPETPDSARELEAERCEECGAVLRDDEGIHCDACQTKIDEWFDNQSSTERETT